MDSAAFAMMSPADNCSVTITVLLSTTVSDSKGRRKVPSSHIMAMQEYPMTSKILSLMDSFSGVRWDSRRFSRRAILSCMRTRRPVRPNRAIFSGP